MERQLVNRPDLRACDRDCARTRGPTRCREGRRCRARLARRALDRDLPRTHIADAEGRRILGDVGSQPSRKSLVICERPKRRGCVSSKPARSRVGSHSGPGSSTVVGDPDLAAQRADRRARGARASRIDRDEPHDGLVAAANRDLLAALGPRDELAELRLRLADADAPFTHSASVPSTWPTWPTQRSGRDETGFRSITG